jgi:hypothetical protein
LSQNAWIKHLSCFQKGALLKNVKEKIFLKKRKKGVMMSSGIEKPLERVQEALAFADKSMTENDNYTLLLYQKSNKNETNLILLWFWGVNRQV